MSLEYSEPIYKSISSQHINNIKFILKTLFLAETESLENQNLIKIGLILTQISRIKESWKWIVQIIKMKSLKNSDSVLDYLLSVSKKFMDSTLITEMILVSLETERSGKLYDRIES